MNGWFNAYRCVFLFLPLKVYSLGSRWKPGMSLGSDPQLGPQLQRRILAFLAGEVAAPVAGALEKRLEAKAATAAGQLVVHASPGASGCVWAGRDARSEQSNCWLEWGFGRGGVVAIDWESVGNLNDGMGYATRRLSSPKYPQ